MNRGAIPRRSRRFHILHPAPQGGILKGYPADLPRGGSLNQQVLYMQDCFAEICEELPYENADKKRQSDFARQYR